MNPTPHEILNPDNLLKPVGFSHAVVAAPGRTVYLGGQTGHDKNGKVVSYAMADQFAKAAGNVVKALAAAGGSPEHIVSLQIYVTDVGEYRGSLDAVGEAYQKHFGRHYPAIALFGVPGLFDQAAKVELLAVAVIPD